MRKHRQTFESEHENTKRASAKDLYQSGQPPSLIRDLTICMGKHRVPRQAKSSVRLGTWPGRSELSPAGDLVCTNHQHAPAHFNKHLELLLATAFKGYANAPYESLSLFLNYIPCTSNRNVIMYKPVPQIGVSALLSNKAVETSLIKLWPVWAHKSVHICPPLSKKRKVQEWAQVPTNV